MKPRIWKASSGMWVCGLNRDPSYSPDSWGVGDSPSKAFTIWKRLNHVS